MSSQSSTFQTQQLGEIVDLLIDALHSLTRHLQLQFQALLVQLVKATAQIVDRTFSCKEWIAKFVNQSLQHGLPVASEQTLFLVEAPIAGHQSTTRQSDDSRAETESERGQGEHDPGNRTAQGTCCKCKEQKGYKNKSPVSEMNPQQRDKGKEAGDLLFKPRTTSQHDSPELVGHYSHLRIESIYLWFQGRPASGRRLKQTGDKLEQVVDRARWFVLLVFALLATACGQNVVSSWDPVEQFPNARTVHLIGLNDRLGSDAAMPFLGGNPTLHHESGTADFQTQGEINFFLFHQQAVKVKLEGRSDKTSQIEFLVNGHRLKKAEISAEWSRFELELPVAATLQGKNKLEFRFPGTTTWRQVAFETAEPRPQITEGPGLASLQLPFDAILDYPVSEDSSGSVELDVEPWVEEGAPAIESWQLELEFKNEQGERIVSRMVHSEGDKSVQFPTLPPYSMLTLRATSPDRLPGQFGLIVKGKPPVLAQAAPTTAKNLPAPAKPPTIVLFVVDTLRADYLQPYGFPHPTSPRLMEFRKDAVLYRECLAPSPWTKPSMATLVTGLPPEEHGVLDFADRLSDDSTTLAETLSEAGYQCRAWVNNGLLDADFGYAQGYQTYSLVPAPTSGPKQVGDALESLKLSDTAPSFLYFHLLDPHTPYIPSPKNRKKMLEEFGLSTKKGEWGSAGLEQTEVSRFIAQLAAGSKPELIHRGEVVRALYSGCVADSDEAFGLLTDWLKQNNLYDNALIVVTSDHGEELMDHGSVGHLTTLYRELVRVPLLVKFPQNRRAGDTVEDLCQLSQVGPTMLETALGSEALPTQLIPLEQSEDSPIYLGADVGRDAVRVQQGDRNYHIHIEGVRMDSLVLSRYFSSTRRLMPIQLFDLEKDEREVEDLTWQRPGLTLFLSAVLRRNRLAREAVKVQGDDAEKLRKTLKTLQYL